MTKQEAKYYVDRCLEPPQDFFDWCLSKIPVYKWYNKQKTIISADRQNSKLIEKRLTKVSLLDFNAGFYTFTIVLVTSSRIEIQTYGYWSNIIQGKESLEYELVNLELFENGEHICVGSFWRGYGFGLVSIGTQGGKYTGTIGYENDWKEKVKDISELKYLNHEDIHDFDYHWISHLYKYKSEIEFLQKIGAKTMAQQLAKNSDVDYRTLTAKWMRRNKTLLKNNTDSFKVFEMKRRISERGGKVVTGIEKYMTYRDINLIPKQVGIVSFQNWVIKNKVDMQYYRDYLGMLKDIGVKADHENFIKPKDLRKAHDNAVQLMNELNIERGDALLKKRLKTTMKLEREIGDYLFIVPKTLKELVIEGKRLHHCVGSSNYVNGHKTGRTTIVFVRKKNEQNVPFFTLEYQNKLIKQLRGKHNQSAPPEVKAAADEWLKQVNSKKRLKKAS